jgi:hypothetical protein
MTSSKTRSRGTCQDGRGRLLDAVQLAETLGKDGLKRRVFSSGLESSSQVPRLRGISLEGLKRNPNTECKRGVWLSVS